MLQVDLMERRQEVPHAQVDKLIQPVFLAGPVAKKQTWTIPSLLVILFYSCFYGFLFFLVMHLLAIFKGFTSTIGKVEFRWSFKDYVLYRFSYFIVWTYGAKTMLLLCTGCILLSLGMVVYVASTGTSLAVATYDVFNMLIDPSAARAQETLAGRGVGAIVSVAGLVFFALLLTLTQDAFNTYFHWFQMGKSPIVEANHVVIVGFTVNTTGIIGELCQCYAPQGGTCIVLLATESATEVEGAIREAGIDHQGSTIMVRRGHPKNLPDLREVSADSCATIVLDGASPDASREMRDSFVLQALISLQGVGWPLKGHILALCSLEQNQAIFEKIGGPRTHVVHLDEFMGKLMVQSCRTPGLCQVMSSLFGYADSEFYLHPVPEAMYQTKFTAAQKNFPNAIIAGVVSNTGETILCPGVDHNLAEGETFIVLAEDETALVSSPSRPKIEKGHTRRFSREQSREKLIPTPDHVLIVGWNREILPSVIYELELSLRESSTVTILAAKPVEERQQYIEILQRRKGKSFRNIGKVRQAYGSLEAGMRTGETVQLIKSATQAFILSNDDTPVNLSDANALAAVLTIREILASAGKPRMIPVVPEIRDPNSARLCRHINVFDFLQSSVIPAQIISNLAVQPKIAPVLLTLLSGHDGAQIAVYPIDDYMCNDEVDSISFFEAMSSVIKSGDVLIGWTKEKDTEAEPDLLETRVSQDILELLPETDWEINPSDKQTKRVWCHETDLLLVITWRLCQEALQEY